MTCRNCLGVDWVCENHSDRPWGGMSSSPTACECGAGAPCPCCCFEMAAAGLVLHQWRELALEAIADVESAVRETNWGTPTFGPDAAEALQAKANALIEKESAHV